MSQIAWNEVQDRAQTFAAHWANETRERAESQTFWSEFLTVFGVDRRRHGAFFEYAVKKGSGGQGFIDMFWPGRMLAEQKSGGKDLAKAKIQAFEYLETLPDHDLPELIVLSDFNSFHVIMLASRDEYVFPLADLVKNVKLFGVLVGEKAKATVEEQPVNRKAAEAMARLHNQLRDDNYVGHDLEVLLVRLVFCLFADDSGIFEHGLLHEFIAKRTADDGSDLGSKLVQVFDVLNTSEDLRQGSLDDALAGMPYVNGGLFAESIRTPSFTSAMRRDLLAAMQLDWSQVSPAIFGSMFQGVMDEKTRRNLGAHYTSETNILRVIKPLFLDDLYAEFAKVRRSPKRLAEFHDKLASLKFLDPACGCGNFLVITYRELRKLEHKVVDALNKGNKTLDWLAASEHGQLKVNVDQMYGIELEEFPALIAQTALWLTDHQLNIEFSQLSGKTFKRIPLTTSPTIVHGNALTTDWTTIVSPNELNYILGNPPFNGSRTMSREQKANLLSVVGKIKEAGFLDFVAGWYFNATDMMSLNPDIRTALVSTNSISQGEQTSILWKPLFERGISIDFAHQTFKWSNDAKGNAAVYCVVVGFSLIASKQQRRIYEYPDIKAEPNEVIAKHINAYLVDAPDVFVGSRQHPISEVPEMSFGNMPADGGLLLLNQFEKDELIAAEPGAARYILPMISAREFLHSIPRYCLWLVDISPLELKAMPSVLRRIAKLRELRLASSRPQLADIPTRFAQITQKPIAPFILIPAHSSENRQYIPIGMFDAGVVSHNSCLVIPNATLYHFGVLTSRMHMAWMRVVAGRLKSDYRYSKDIVYNNFIWPEATDEQKAETEKLAQAVLDARALFPDSSLADLYDPLMMPQQLAKAHKRLDQVIDRLYTRESLATDADRAKILFMSYEYHDNARSPK